MAASVIHTQDSNGLWHASLLDAGSYPQPENSASGFFCYGLAWGIRNGLLDEEIYREPMLRAWTTLCSYVHTDGKLGYIQPVGHDPKPADENSTDVYGVGAFLLAGSEILKMEKSNENK
jgi:rhamnogalacturonyl hydrolase YesR